MSRRKKQPDPGLYPDPGDGKQIRWLPRDVRLGFDERTPRGTLMAGWDTVTDTYQLWRVTDPGLAEFVGYIVGSPPGGIKRDQ